MKTWKTTIDDAVKLCGSQNALADRLGIAKQTLSNSKNGRGTITKEKIGVLACLLDADPAQLWELQEVANLPRRNPFLQAAGAVLTVFLCVVLSVGGNDAKAYAYEAKPISAQANPIHIVHLLAVDRPVAGVPAGLASLKFHEPPAEA